MDKILLEMNSVSCLHCLANHLIYWENVDELLRQLIKFNCGVKESAVENTLATQYFAYNTFLIHQCCTFTCLLYKLNVTRPNNCHQSAVIAIRVVTHIRLKSLLL